jgi:hypothetical protein
MPIEVDPSEVHSIEVDPSQVQAMPAAPAAPQSWLDRTIQAVKDYGAGIGEQINPVTMLSGARDTAYNAVTSPVQTVKALGQAQGAVGQKAIQSFQSGDYLSGLRHAIGYMLPLIGPQIDAMGDEMATNPAHALGSATGFGLAMAAPDSPVVKSALQSLPAMPVIPKYRNPNAVQAAAVDYARGEGIPISAATATGNKFVQGVQKLADYSPIGSVIGENAKAAEAAGFTRVGGKLADQVYPTPMVPETAGAKVGARFDDTISGLRQDADSAYGDFRVAAQDPKNAISVPSGPPTANGAQPMQDMAMPVDVRALKQNLQPKFDDMQWMPVADRNSSAGYTAIKKILEGPDFIPATSAEMGLGGLKSLARDAASPDLRNVSQGIGADAAGQLQGAIDQAAAKAGPDVLKALQDGRALHAEKMGTADVMDKLRDEPVQLFNQATFAQDAGVDQLREVAKIAPAEMPMLGRAYLDKLLGMATAEGGFDKAGTLASQWQNLGPATKKILFKNPMLVQNLDKFFSAAKQASLNPNPSGSALTGAIAGGVTYAFHDPVHGVPMIIGEGPLSKLLHSPAGVDALTAGLKVPVANKAAASMAAARILKIAGDAAQPAVAAQNPIPEEQTGQTTGALPPALSGRITRQVSRPPTARMFAAYPRNTIAHASVNFI